MNPTPTLTLALLALVALAHAGLGAYVAHARGRPVVEGLLIAGLFAPLGVLVVALLPAPGRGPVAEDEPEDEDDSKASSYLRSLRRP